MEIEELEQQLRSLLKGEHSSIDISFNDHSCNYVTFAKALEYDPDEAEGFVSREELKRSIELNAVWSIQWYPLTPIGFHRVRASRLEACLGAILEHTD